MARLGEGKPLGFGHWQDQHNRTWTARTTPEGNAVGPFSPFEWEDAGWNVHPQCLPPHDKIRPLAKTGAILRCDIEYDVVIGEREHEEREFNKALDKLMDQFYKDSRTAHSPITDEMMRKMGQRPASAALMRAAKAGVPWVIYGQGQCPPKLKPFLMESKPKVADERGYWEEGMDTGEGAESEAELVAVASEPVPVKRGPGRPRKHSVEGG